MAAPEQFPEQQLHQPKPFPVPETAVQDRAHCAKELGQKQMPSEVQNENGAVTEFSFSPESREHFYEHSVAPESAIEGQESVGVV